MQPRLRLGALDAQAEPAVHGFPGGAREPDGVSVKGLQCIAFAIAILLLLCGCRQPPSTPPDAPEEVIFWHFWGGRDRAVVDSIVDAFHASQNRYRVRAIAMPGNNLQAKLFLSVAGGDPPDLVNQDDPVLADWARRGLVEPLGSFASDDEIANVSASLLPPARRLSEVDGQLWAVCNGLDIRALYCNIDALAAANLHPPQTISDLDAIAEHFAPPGMNAMPSTVGYLPDSRRLWAWGPVFGGDFYEYENQQVTMDSPALEAAVFWMKSYRDRYGAENLASFRQGDQSLPGKTFPLLPVDVRQKVGRYVTIMDGQWRVRDIAAFNETRRQRQLPPIRFDVVPLPPPGNAFSKFKSQISDPQNVQRGRKNAGWVNGNFFIVPRGAKCSRGAWEFAKFWIGLGEAADSNRAANQAAAWYADGGWIPPTASIVNSPRYRDYLESNPLMTRFVDLAKSPNQFPVPAVQGAAFFKREVERLGYDAMLSTLDDESLRQRIKRSQTEIQSQLDSQSRPPHQATGVRP